MPHQGKKRYFKRNYFLAKAEVPPLASIGLCGMIAFGSFCNMLTAPTKPLTAFVSPYGKLTALVVPLTAFESSCCTVTAIAVVQAQLVHPNRFQGW